MIRYSRLNLNSKNQLIKRLTGKNVNKNSNAEEKTKELFNYCSKNFNHLWKDHLSQSDPEKGKWVRNCSYSKLSKLIKKLDCALLKPYDELLPDYIQGGVTGGIIKKSGYKIPKCSQSAAISLMDGKKGRSILTLDIKSFYEQITQEQVVKLFTSKFQCSKSVSWAIANLCCVPKGKKGNNNELQEKILARGFATSGRLAIWSSLDFFDKLNKLVKEELKGHAPLFVIFVDDIGISAVNISEERLRDLAQKIIDLARSHNLIIHSAENHEKTKIIPSQESIKEYLGLRLSRNKIHVNIPTIKRINKEKNLQKEKLNKEERQKSKRSLEGLERYRNFTKKVSNS